LNDDQKGGEKAISDASEIIVDAIAGKVSLFDLIRSAPDRDYKAHIDMHRMAAPILSDVGAAKALVSELQLKIAEQDIDLTQQEEIAKQLARKDGHRRFDKLMSQRAAAFDGSPSLLSGQDFETCLS
jgi:hypothetical protein